MKTFYLKSALFLITLLFCHKIDAQTYAGISVNVGNNLSYSPELEGLASPPAISGGILLTIQEEISEKLALQYGFGLGVLGFKLSVNEIDTLGGAAPTIYREYSTFYGRFNLMVARIINLKSKELLIGFGGGGTYFYTFPSSWDYGSGILFPDGNTVELFSAEFNTPSSSVLPFVRITTQFKLNFHFTIGLEYTHHFNSMLEGTYEFYQTSPPRSGNISLNPREISLTFLIKVSKH
jgi:hypothetical protein